MRTGTSGMNAQASRLSVVADNVANVNTTGYKSASCQFSSLVLSNSPTSYECGAILASTKYNISAQGSLMSTSSTSDLALSGPGFFIVSDPSGAPFLTRAGSFVKNDSGDLVNSAGYSLMGFKLTQEQLSFTVNGYDGLVPINLTAAAMSASPSTAGTFTANVPSTAAALDPAELPSMNNTDSTYTSKSSLLTYDRLGAVVKVDVFLSKTDDSTWEMTIFNSADAAEGGGFPYGADPLLSETLVFDVNGALDESEPTQIVFSIPGGAEFSLNIAEMTQLAAPYSVISARVNGTPAGDPYDIEYSKDGYVYATYNSGTRIPMYRIPLGQVTSADLLKPMAGNVFSPNQESGIVTVGFAQTNGLGSILSKTLEQSTVDLASELTSMIDAQRGYTANSKVFQTGAELMDVLVNLKR
ncbi:flagellar hook protein FlgE [Aestuariivirga sp.]|uniref:flagellar hook protein FlgE n=1 Tax=Aestuariivirga sp. TaxID=2650926 RepID=UPI0037830F1B